jgi:dipeptidase
MMKKILVGVFLALALGLAAFAAIDQNRDTNCYTVVVGRKAAAAGSVIVAHNEDDSGDIIVNLRKIQARDYGAPQNVALGHGAVYESDGKTNGFLWIEATTQEFADSFINQYGVLLTSDSCSSKEQKNDLTDGGIGYMLRRLVAEKAKSAREAVTIAGALVEKYGYTGSGRTYTLADKNEAWMMAVIKGRHWIAQKVPDEEVVVIPNHYIIREIDLNDPSRFLGSRDIVEYAKAGGWYDEARDGRFDFKKAFARTSARELVFDGNTLRHWRGLNYFSDKKWDISDAYPFSFKPARKVTPESIMALLRDHYEGTEYDSTDGYKNGTPNKAKYRTICTATTITAFIASLNPALPDPLSVSLWIALGRPDTTVFLPLYYGVESLPTNAGLGTAVHDYAIFYKQHFEDAEWRAQRAPLLNTKILRLQKAAETNYGPMRVMIDRELAPTEKQFIEGRGKLEAEIASLDAKDKAAAIKKLTAYVADAFAKLDAVYDELLKKNPGH